MAKEKSRKKSKQKSNGGLEGVLKRASVKAKILVLDTNILIHDPDSLLNFKDNVIVIPIDVIEELDELKKGNGEIPYSTRQALRLLDSLQEERKKFGENLKNGVKLANGGIMVGYEATRNCFKKDKPDNWIVSIAKEISDKFKNRIVMIISKDSNVRTKAEFRGVPGRDYTRDKTSIFKQYGQILKEGEHTNGICSVRYQMNKGQILRYSGKDDCSTMDRGRELSEVNFKPKNIDQECALDALRNPHIELVALTGQAGSGKTLLSLAVGLAQTMKKGALYDQVIVARPNITMGGYDLGFLPGDKNEKLEPWMQPISDAVEVLIKTNKEEKDGVNGRKFNNYKFLVENGIIQVESLGHMRGRSLPKSFIIIDEAQNSRPLDAKTLVTRCAVGTKIVFTGDLDQIDTPYLDAESNGLAYLISKFINEENFCYLNLKDTVRSRLAEQGARLM